MDYPRATLVLVKGKYYVQATIPQPLREAFNGRVQERKSTSTSDRKDAERRLHSIAAEIYAKFDEAQERSHPLVLAARDLQTRLRGGVNWSDGQWLAEDFSEAAEEVKHRVDQVRHYPDPTEADDYEDKAGVAYWKDEVEQAYQNFDLEVQQRQKTQLVVSRTVSEAADAYFGTCNFQRSKTEDAYRRGVAKFINICGDLPITKIDKPTASKFAEKLGQTLAFKTLQRDVSALRLVMGYCEEQGWVGSNPFSQLKLKGKGRPQRARRPFRRSQLGQLFAAEMNSQDRLCLSILAATGMRLDEAALLQWEDVCMEGGIAYFDLMRTNKLVKNESSARQVPIPKALKLPPRGKGRIFDYRTDADGKAENAASKALMRYIRPLRDDPADGRLTVHSLRHTYKDLLRDAGVPVDVQEFLMGHTGANVGSRYGSGPSVATKADYMEQVDLSFLR